MGPVLTPTLVSSYGEYERIFGGLTRDGDLARSVLDFFTNGGSSVLVVRVFDAGTSTASPKATFSVGAAATYDALGFEASSEGSWGRRLRLKISHAGVDSRVADRLGVALTDLFHLSVERLASEAVSGATDAEVVESEVFSNVTVVESSRRLDRVLATQSRFLRLASPALPAASQVRPPEDDDLVAAASTGFDSEALDRAAYAGALQRLEDLSSEFNLLVLPSEGALPSGVHADAAKTCQARRALYVLDPEPDWASAAGTPGWTPDVASLGIGGSAMRNVAAYYPRVVAPNSLADGLPGTFPVGGFVAGAIARTDSERGIWKAPAGLDAGLNGATAPTRLLTDSATGVLNKEGVNCLRTFPNAGTVIWGARTLRGADVLADEYKYVPVRRLALHVEESLQRGLRWVVFEPNDEPLWAQIRLNVGSFMNVLFRQGAFQGQSAREAYFVKCDKETTTQDDVALGVVNVVVGFAPLKPAEFVVVKLQQMAGQSVV